MGSRRRVHRQPLKARWGDAARPGNDFCYDHLPFITGDHSTYRTTVDMADGKVAGFLVIGENPAVGSADGKLHRLALSKLHWLVVRDLVEVEMATFWKDGPEIDAGELRTTDIGTEVFFLPAAAHTEGRHLHPDPAHAAVAAQGGRTAGRLPLGAVVLLLPGPDLRVKLAGSSEWRDRSVLDLTWDCPLVDAEPHAEAVLQEINGFGPDGLLPGFAGLKDDGSTACGCRIYSGCFAGGVNQTSRRRPGSEQTWVAPEWGWAWPANRRILYNRASADPAGRPWSERKAYVWWDAEEGRWTGHDVPNFTVDMAPDYRPEEGAAAQWALGGADPFIVQSDGPGGCSSPTACWTVACPPTASPTSRP